MIDPKTRRDSLGASEWSQVLGISPFGDAVKVFDRKTGRNDHGFSSSRMADGNDAEAFVLRLAEARLPLREGSKLVGQQVKIYHPREQWLSATLDGIADVIIDGQPMSAVIEAKTISTPIYKSVPEYYLIQVLAQMYVTGLRHGFLVVWSTKDTEFRSFLIKMDDHEEWFKESHEKVKHFWFEHVVKDVSPPRNDIVREKDVTLDEALIEAYLQAQEDERLAKERKDAAKEAIMEALGNPKEYRAKDHRYQVDLVTTISKRLDTESLKADQADLVGKYQVESSSTRLTVKRIGLKPSKA